MRVNQLRVETDQHLKELMMYLTDVIEAMNLSPLKSRALSITITKLEEAKHRLEDELRSR